MPVVVLLMLVSEGESLQCGSSCSRSMSRGEDILGKWKNDADEDGEDWPSRRADHDLSVSRLERLQRGTRWLRVSARATGEVG
ncbi:hypothetical protein BC567DRAFT_217598 [Phyllosticta citribraziliensis]